MTATDGTNVYKVFVFLVVIGLMLWQLVHIYRLMKLRKRCTVSCFAQCIDAQSKKWGRTNLYNATYSYEYMGMTMEGNNGLWCDSGISGGMEKGCGTQICIDPDDPRQGIFDPLAKAEIKYRIFMSIYTAAIAAALFVLTTDPGLLPHL